MRVGSHRGGEPGRGSPRLLWTGVPPPSFHEHACFAGLPQARFERACSAGTFDAGAAGTELGDEQAGEHHRGAPSFLGLRPRYSAGGTEEEAS
jgi:hypothetical protein